MRKALSIAAKDLRILLSDKGSLFWILGFPVVYALLFGAVFSSVGQGDGSFKMHIAVVNDDKSELSEQFIDELTSQDNITIEATPLELTFSDGMRLLPMQ